MKTISISLSPNTEKDDIFLALKLIFQPKEWKKGEVIEKLKEEFRKYLKVKYAFSFNSGRAALMAILNAIGVKAGDEILLQAFTCNAAVNPIINQTAKPIFVDVEDTININPEDLKKKITQKSKAVMVQHTFGWPAQIDKILEIVKQNNLLLIEDCAHSLGAKYSGKFCGTFGDAAFFSFGRDKIISSVFGGMAVTNDENLAKKLEEFQKNLDYPSSFWIFQQLLHPILTNYLILPAYSINCHLGRIFLGTFHKLSVLSKAVYKKEKVGEIPKYFPKLLPNALAILALNQFRKLERFNEHRRELADFYGEGLKNANFTLPLAKSRNGITPTFLRYPILTNFDTNKVLKETQKRKILLDDGWRKNPIVPPDTNICKMKYPSGSCPKAEKIAKGIINLPTHINISKKEAEKILDVLCLLKK